MLTTIRGWFNKGDTCEKHYTLKKVLGSGSFATVKMGICKEDGSKWAIKIINKKALGPDDTEALESEVDILRKIHHKNIVYLKENFEEPEKFYMVMELCKGGELFDRVVLKEHYNEAEAKNVISQVAEALQYCHAQGIVHRDLKPENLIYEAADTEVLKLADFGLAQILEPQTALTTACGTPGYVAPEILMGHGYDKEVDMWSLGVISYILLCGFPPFYEDNQSDLFDAIRNGAYDFPDDYWRDVSTEAKDLIRSLLILDPKERLSATGLLQDSPFITGVARTEKLEHFTSNLTKYNARRKFRAGIMSIQVVNFMKSGSGGGGVADILKKKGADAATAANAESKDGDL